MVNKILVALFLYIVIADNSQFLESFLASPYFLRLRTFKEKHFWLGCDVGRRRLVFNK